MAIRLDRNESKVYFGRPGSLVQLPWPKGEIDQPYDRLTYDFLTGGGQHMVSALTGGSRPYTVNWNALHVDNYKLLEQYWVGAMGKGPWALVNPATRNMLLPNQAATTNIYNDARHWKTLTGLADSGSLLSNSNAAKIRRPGAVRNLQWQFPVAAAASPTLTFTTAYRNWWGVPVVPGLSYAWSVCAIPDGTVDTSITLAAKITWMNAAGATITEPSGGDTVVTAWTKLSALGVAPPGAAYARPMLVATGSTITTGGSVYVDEPMLEQDTVVNDWAPGTGVRPVEMLSLSDTVPFANRFRRNVSMLLRELAP